MHRCIRPDTSTALPHSTRQRACRGVAASASWRSTALFPRPTCEAVLTETMLKPDEIFSAIPIPPAPIAWTKIKDRQVYDFAMASSGGVHSRRERGLARDGRASRWALPRSGGRGRLGRRSTPKPPPRKIPHLAPADEGERVQGGPGAGDCERTLLSNYDC